MAGIGATDEEVGPCGSEVGGGGGIVEERVDELLSFVGGGVGDVVGDFELSRDPSCEGEECAADPFVVVGRWSGIDGVIAPGLSEELIDLVDDSVIVHGLAWRLCGCRSLLVGVVGLGWGERRWGCVGGESGQTDGSECLLGWLWFSRLQVIAGAVGSGLGGVFCELWRGGRG